MPQTAQLDSRRRTAIIIWNASIPSFGNLAPRDISSRAAKEVCDEGRGVGPGGLGVYLDFADAIKRLGEDGIRERYGNLFDMYEKITGENAYRVPMRIYPAVHYAMGGMWVDYNLMSNAARAVRHRRGELLRPRRQPPRGQRADAGPGRWLFRPALHHRPLFRLARKARDPRLDIPSSRKCEEDARAMTNKLLSVNGKRTATSFHRELGKLLWEKCGMAATKRG